MLLLAPFVTVMKTLELSWHDWRGVPSTALHHCLKSDVPLLYLKHSIRTIKLFLSSMQVNSINCFSGCCSQHALKHILVCSESFIPHSCAPSENPPVLGGSHSLWFFGHIPASTCLEKQDAFLSIPWLFCLKENSVQGINSHNASPILFFLKAVLVPVCSINKNNLFHPAQQGSPGAQKPLWNGASQNKALKITLISFDLIPFHARPTIPQPRMSQTSHISAGHFCPGAGMQPQAKGGWISALMSEMQI